MDRNKQKEIIDAKIEEYRKNNNIQIKCESDKTKLIINYIFSQLEGPMMSIELPLEFKDKVYELYSKVRGKIEKTGILKPENLAQALIVYAYERSRFYLDNGRPLTYTDIKMAYTGETDRKKVVGVAAIPRYGYTLEAYLRDPEYMIKEKEERKRLRYERTLKYDANEYLYNQIRKNEAKE